MPNSLEQHLKRISSSSSISNLLNLPKGPKLSLRPRNDVNNVASTSNKKENYSTIDDSTANSFISSATPTWIHGILQQKECVSWCLYWFISNVIITFYNKHILSSMNISPTTNTFIHMFFTFIGSDDT